MANIEIQRKSSSHAIWWVLGIIALVILLLVMFGWGDTSRTVAAPAAPERVGEPVGLIAGADAIARTADR